VWRDPRNKDMTVISVPNKSCGIKEVRVSQSLIPRAPDGWNKLGLALRFWLPCVHMCINMLHTHVMMRAQGDIIKCIDGRKVKEWSVEKCYQRLRGKEALCPQLI
jgi:hypothetical protein